MTTLGAGGHGRKDPEHVLVGNKKTRAQKKALAKGHLEQKQSKPVMEI